jgi:peptidoglycan lytic transglycosylase G
LSGGNRSQPPRERTREERERDRLERELRQLSRAGRSEARPGLARVGRGAPSRPWLGRAAILALVIVALGALAIVLVSHHAKPRPSAIPHVVEVVIPEGETRMQIAQIAAAAGLTGSYRAASKRSPLLSPARYGAPRATPDLEGFLFPATYEMYVGAPARRLVSEQLAAFQERFGASEARRARALHITPYQLLTVASMVEREAQTERDRPLIAAVIYKRLRSGMPLGIDATLYYALELARGVATYTRELTDAQLQIDSPYNTRIHAGLPPTPISNPGMASIEAAAHPAHVPYLYYVLAADGCGEHVFSSTLAQFERDAAAYRAALAKNGGHLPACKRK